MQLLNPKIRKPLTREGWKKLLLADEISHTPTFA